MICCGQRSDCQRYRSFSSSSVIDIVHHAPPRLSVVVFPSFLFASTLCTDALPLPLYHVSCCILSNITKPAHPERPPRFISNTAETDYLCSRSDLNSRNPERFRASENRTIRFFPLRKTAQLESNFAPEVPHYATNSTQPPCRLTPNGLTQFSSVLGPSSSLSSPKACTRGENGYRRGGPRWSPTSFRGWGPLWNLGETRTRFSVAHSESRSAIGATAWLTSLQEEVRRRIHDEGLWEGRHVCRLPVGMPSFSEPRVYIHSSSATFAQLISEIYRNAQVRY